METKKTASSSATQKLITLQNRAGTAHLETNPYTKKWSVRFMLAAGFTAENIDGALTLVAEAKAILSGPDNAWQEIANEQRLRASR